MDMKKLWFFRKKKSGEVAKERLKILLISDRIDCSPEVMELIKRDIAKILCKYMQIDTSTLELEFSRRKINVFW
jgi:cell division topological specificity factor